MCAILYNLHFLWDEHLSFKGCQECKHYLWRTIVSDISHQHSLKVHLELLRTNNTWPFLLVNSTKIAHPSFCVVPSETLRLCIWNCNTPSFIWLISLTSYWKQHQRVQNHGPQIILHGWKADHATPFLRELDWVAVGLVLVLFIALPQPTRMNYWGLSSPSRSLLSICVASSPCHASDDGNLSDSLSPSLDFPFGNRYFSSNYVSVGNFQVQPPNVPI